MTSAAHSGHATDAMPKGMILALAAVGLWLVVSEVARYFALVMPMTREAFIVLPDVAPMNAGVFALWSIWMTLLTLVAVWSYWLHAAIFGHGWKSVLLSSVFGWVFFFVLFWFGNYNMGLAHPPVIAVALPWAFAELVIAGAIAQRVFRSAAST